MSEIGRISGMGDVLGLLYLAPLALAGMIWLALVTDLALLLTIWPLLLLFFALTFLFRRLAFFIIFEAKPGIYADFDGSLETIVIWWAALLYGPSVLWLGVLWALFTFTRGWLRLTSTGERWNRARNSAAHLAIQTLPGLAALALYAKWGGIFPLPGLALRDMLLALGATGIQFVLSSLLLLPLVVFWSSSSILLDDTTSRRAFIMFVAASLTIPRAADIFAILAAGLHSQVGLGITLFFVSNLLLGSYLAHQLSTVVEHNRQRSRELERLEQLGRAIINSPADTSVLPNLLREHLPGMFPPGSQVEIRLHAHETAPAQTLIHRPENWPPLAEEAWEWLRTMPSEAGYFLPKETLPWSGRPSGHAVILTPILRAEDAVPMGGIYLQWASAHENVRNITGLLPAIQTLAAQIASALHSTDVYAQMLAHEKVTQELALAGEIQESFLPDAVPHIAGWQLAATLEPARETSGDFFDVIPLPNGRVGLVMADVADKGLGAALYMSLSRTLIRTYADQYGTRPDRVLAAANQRILRDTRSDLFVTVFYGILDPETGKLTYCNAGHNPGFLVSSQDGRGVRALGRTGLPLGLFDDRPWSNDTVQLMPGDVLVLYTDGVTEAQNRAEMLFGEERLAEVAQTLVGRTAGDVQNALLAEVRRFVGDEPQYDDITLLVVVRES